MGNMSYCRFENTASDLQDCVSALEEVEEFAELDLSTYEREAASRLYALAQEFITHYESMLDLEVSK